MADDPTRDSLAAHRYVSLMLRILIDKSGTVESGSLVDLEGRSIVRFIGWDGLTTRLRDWVHRYAELPAQDSSS